MQIYKACSLQSAALSLRLKLQAERQKNYLATTNISMPAQLLVNIKMLTGLHANNNRLHGAALSVLPSIENAWLLIEDGIIAGFGPMDQLPTAKPGDVIDTVGRLVLPAWC